MSKMFSTSPDPAQNSIRIQQDDKFFSRLLSKESSMANPSFRVYHGGVAGEVPFLWESRPGTPKCTFNETTLPPLTPPPSYFVNSINKPVKKQYSKSNFLHILFPKLMSNNNLKKSTVSSSSSSLASNSSWSSSNLSMFVPITSPRNYLRARSRLSRGSSSFDSRAEYEEVAVIGSPTSTLCFPGLKGCYGWR